MKTNKRGISLIVLVITIIVMIILAASIILSLNSANVIGKSSWAQISSDRANLQTEYATMLADIIARDSIVPGSYIGITIDDVRKSTEFKNWCDKVKKTNSRFEIYGEEKITPEDIEPAGIKVVLTISEDEADAFGLTLTEDKLGVVGYDWIKIGNIQDDSALSDVKVYAKLYQYNDDSGYLLELSSDKDYVDTDSSITYIKDYGNIGNKDYKLVENVTAVDIIEKYDGRYPELFTQEKSVLPPWLVLNTYEHEEGYRKYVQKVYEPEYNITNVKIVDEINPKDMSCWFGNMVELQQIENIENINTSQVTDMSYLFAYCWALENIDLSDFETGNVKNMSYMFAECESLSTIDITSFKTSNVEYMIYMFGECYGLEELNFEGIDTSSVKDISYMFSSIPLVEIDLTPLDTSNVINLAGLFLGCDGVEHIDLSVLDTSNAINMSRLFSGCISLTGVTLEGIDTKKVKDMSYMFEYCHSLKELDLSVISTENVEDMSHMFWTCDDLERINLNGFSTSKVKDMNRMFEMCRSLTELDLSMFDTRSTTDMSYMFVTSTSLNNIYIGDFWKTTQADVTGMFTDCPATLVKK